MIVEEICLAAFEFKHFPIVYTVHSMLINWAHTHIYTRITRARTCECFNYLFIQRKILQLSATSNKVSSLLQ